ncbi:hypothetical protein Nepgr_014391 [Nepenthes gracilis]|uniref:Uncharacterized protein n=1 Tax=Nepenthes gracilis TaxID=150966 RepID=A0AAD3SKP9_NEPGR|nr:hypothetical protein Nepgr_014391 [Nepenthes gracilis]
MQVEVAEVEKLAGGERRGRRGVGLTKGALFCTVSCEDWRSHVPWTTGRSPLPTAASSDVPACRVRLVSRRGNSVRIRNIPNTFLLKRRKKRETGKKAIQVCCINVSTLGCSQGLQLQCRHDSTPVGHSTVDWVDDQATIRIW